MKFVGFAPAGINDDDPVYKPLGSGSTWPNRADGATAGSRYS
jgi:hypothetical protein